MRIVPRHQGEGGPGNDLIPAAPRRRQWDHGSTDGEIFNNIKNGVPPDFNMVPFKDQLKDEEIWNLVIYIRSIAKRNSRDHFASGSGLTWNFSSLLGTPLPPSMWNGARVEMLVKMPLPFQPPLGLSMRPSIPLAKNPMGYGTRNIMNFPSTSASNPSERFPVAIGTSLPTPSMSNRSTKS